VNKASENAVSQDAPEGNRLKGRPRTSHNESSQGLKRYERNLDE
jgi:hypothetical protein